MSDEPEKPKDPFAGLTIDFGGGETANGSGDAGPISFGPPIAFDAPPATVPIPRSKRPGARRVGVDCAAKRTKLLISGSGRSGLTAAFSASRATLEPIVLAGVVPGGQ